MMTAATLNRAPPLRIKKIKIHFLSDFHCSGV